ncbi:MAG: histidine kinase [Flavobacteriaceae bacterium]
MLKPLTLTLSLILFFSCQNRDPETVFSIEKINALQKRIDTVENDSNFFYLKQIDSVLTDNPSYPDSLKAENSFLIGMDYKQKGKIDSASVYFHDAIGLVHNSLENKRQSFYFLETYNTYFERGLYGDCLTTIEKFRSLLDTVNNNKHFRSIIWALHWEKEVNLKLGNWNKAEKNTESQLKIAKRKDTLSIPYAAIALAEIKYHHLNDKKGAFKLLDEILKNEKKLSLSSKNQLFEEAGILQYYEGNFDSALSNYLMSLKIAKLDSQLYDKISNLADAYNNIGEVYMDLNNNSLSRAYLDSTKFLGFNNLDYRIQKDLLRYELRLAALTDKSMVRAYEVLDSINSYQDKMYAKRMQSQLLDLTKAIKKEKQLLQEKQQSELQNVKLANRILLLSISIGLLALVGYFLYQRKNFIVDRQQLQNQQRLLRSQMNPHFTFNTLYAIQNELKAQPEEAGKHLLTFSRLLRLTLENSTQNYVELEKELEALQKYLDLQRLRHPNLFTYEIVFEENSTKDELLFIPPMLLQPFVENSIEHGFLGIDYPGKITVKLRMQKSFLHCTIEDNGRGISPKMQEFKKSHSIRLISDFILKVTKQKLTIQNKQEMNPDSTGTMVTFLIPFKRTEND